MSIAFASSCLCTPGETPVCGNDGQTYSGACVVSCENFMRINLGRPEIKIAHDGPCKN